MVLNVQHRSYTSTFKSGQFLSSFFIVFIPSFMYHISVETCVRQNKLISNLFFMFIILLHHTCVAAGHSPHTHIFILWPNEDRTTQHIFSIRSEFLMCKIEIQSFRYRTKNTSMRRRIFVCMEFDYEEKWRKPIVWNKFELKFPYKCAHKKHNKL